MQAQNINDKSLNIDNLEPIYKMGPQHYILIINRCYLQGKCSIFQCGSYYYNDVHGDYGLCKLFHLLCVNLGNATFAERHNLREDSPTIFPNKPTLQESFQAQSDRN